MKPVNIAEAREKSLELIDAALRGKGLILAKCDRAFTKRLAIARKQPDGKQKPFA